MSVDRNPDTPESSNMKPHLIAAIRAWWRISAMKPWNPIILALGAVLVAGCATGPAELKSTVKPGDTVKVDYTCRFRNGELAATTLAMTAQDPNEIKSSVFHSPEKFDPFVFQVGNEGLEEKMTMGRSKIIGFDSAIRRELNKKLAGLPVRETVTLDLKADTNETLRRDVRYYSESRIRIRKKERRNSLKQYVAYYGHPPAVGEQYDVDHVFTATVTRVDPVTDTIITRIKHKPGAVYPSDFGSATIIDGGDVYRIVFEVGEGQLVRSGNRVGRIDKVEKHVFTVDWGHPFGHEVLACEVTADRVEK